MSLSPEVVTEAVKESAKAGGVIAGLVRDFLAPGNLPAAEADFWGGCKPRRMAAAAISGSPSWLNVKSGDTAPAPAARPRRPPRSARAEATGYFGYFSLTNGHNAKHWWL